MYRASSWPPASPWPPVRGHVDRDHSVPNHRGAVLDRRDRRRTRRAHPRSGPALHPRTPGFAEPRAAATFQYWRRVGVRIVRRPAWVLAASLAILVALAAPTYWMSTGYDERSMQPATTPSNQDTTPSPGTTRPVNSRPTSYSSGRTAIYGIRGFAALNSVVRVFKKSPVSEVRGPTQPEGKAIPEFTLSGQGRSPTN